MSIQMQSVTQARYSDIPDVTQQVFLVIKNDAAHLERIFKGMFVVARRVLGFSPKASSYPFITREIPIQKNDQEVIIDRCRSRGEFVISRDKGTMKEVCYAIAFASADKYSGSGVMRKAFHDVVTGLGADTAEVATYRDNLDCLRIGELLMNDYFEAMLVFAKQSRTYMSTWQSVAIQQ